jgi:two-component system chemotaxis response regulator CheB
MNIQKDVIKVLIVDDSAFMRRVITTMLESDQSIKVVTFARNGEDAIAKIKKYKPDVVTMDVEMPGLNGLGALRRIMCECPVPVIMLSSLTTAGASQTIEALTLGAVDFVAKPSNRNALSQLASELIQKVKTASGVHVKKFCNTLITQVAKEISATKEQGVVATTDAIRAYKRVNAARKPIELIAVGTSTGGPTALQILLTKLPKNFPCAVVVVQHMPKGFTGPLAKRLDKLSQIEVKEAQDGDEVLPSRVLIAPAGYQTMFKKKGEKLYITLSELSPIKTLFKPSVDVMLLSAVENLGSKVLGVIMTGMGNDGLRGLKSLKSQNGIVLAQNESSCIVYGMPKAAVEAGIVDKVVPLNNLAQEIIEIVETSREQTNNKIS